LELDSFKENLSIDTSTLVDKVEAKLVKLLQEKKLRVGDSIPKEIELSELLGVSRTVIREALIRLRMIGLIETKKKKGAVITSPDIFSILDKSMNPYILDTGTLREIFELRLALEIGMADFIMQRVTPEDIKELREITKTEKRNSRKNQGFNIDYEIAFHGKLYEICKNETMKKFQKMLLPVFNYVHNSGLLTTPVQVKKVVTHEDLVDVIENGTPETLRNAMRTHLESHFERIFLNSN
jgi:GntR family transcriptional repressor for pyruvate dehydrogenase complex